MMDYIVLKSSTQLHSAQNLETLMANTTTPEKSPSWNKVAEFIAAFPHQRILGFPFNEGIPKDRDEMYYIILTDGTKQNAYVDLSTQYRSEGIQWTNPR